ncbi:aldo/keto reductase [Paraflavitalea speifideaquila]|uniref:aldo/keto reductase n=1 Tax=Paraflavitalea speifideaquila TaxID=3076558 RepID=UPI00331308CB
MAIAWTVKNPHVTTAILGATKNEQLTENLKALDILPKLTDDLMQKIEKYSKTSHSWSFPDAQK